jgi:hypothetical protein
MHLSRYAYKRGRNTGEAPADASRRGKSHFRVVKGNGGQMIVRMHNADLITAYEDGRIVLNTRGWHTSPTTRGCMNDALSSFFGRGTLSSVRYRGYSQTGIRLINMTYRYYDGMEFSADGVLLTEAKTFTAKLTDREETAEFRADVKASGFADVFPVLYAAAEPSNDHWMNNPAKKLMTCEHSAHHWPQLISVIKYPYRSNRVNNRPEYPDHKAAMRALTASITKNMTKLVDTDVTVL